MEIIWRRCFLEDRGTAGLKFSVFQKERHGLNEKRRSGSLSETDTGEMSIDYGKKNF